MHYTHCNNHIKQVSAQPLQNSSRNEVERESERERINSGGVRCWRYTETRHLASRRTARCPLLSRHTSAYVSIRQHTETRRMAYTETRQLPTSCLELLTRCCLELPTRYTAKIHTLKKIARCALLTMAHLHSLHSSMRTHLVVLRTQIGKSNNCTMRFTSCEHSYIVVLYLV